MKSDRPAANPGCLARVPPEGRAGPSTRRLAGTADTAACRWRRLPAGPRKPGGAARFAAVVGATLLGCSLALAAGCTGGASPPGEPELVWGRRGVSDGRLQKPRAMAIDDQDRLYIVDMTGRIQVFTRDGTYLYGWRTPESENGKPCGLTWEPDGTLLVADTHYFRVLVYTDEGQLLEERTIGGRCGFGPGEFNFVTDCVRDSAGNYYVAEYGEHDRIQKFSPDRAFVLQWGDHGGEPGRFRRPQGLAVDAHDRIWVADACNHRLQVFDARGSTVRLVRVWGEAGDQPGQLSYPYDLLLDDQGHVYVAEFGNHRVQKFTADGVSLGVWGTQGRRAGQLYQPWALVRDSQGRIHILDTYNHRVQRIRL